ncbi:transcription elongation regulator 1-like protein [Halichoeres trimaculatus]|uniref:transcription elongation regulator 1-like protein n=1 Tax=Halichoeres trimaculatus TaxID=147232 RepID=UPI003D9EEEC6
MMLPVSRFNGQPLGMMTTTTPWMSVSNDPSPPWLWLASLSAAAYQATPPLVFFPPAVWIPEHTHLIQWERPAVEVVPLLPPVYPSSHLHLPLPLPKVAESWISPEEMGVFQRGDKAIHLTNKSIQRPGHAPRNHRLQSPTLVPGRVRGDPKKLSEIKHKVSSSSSYPTSFSSLCSLPLGNLPVSPLHLSLRAAPPVSGGAYCEWSGLHVHESKGAWPFVLFSSPQIKPWLQPIRSLKRKLHLPQQVMKEVPSSIFSSRITLLTDPSTEKPGVSGGEYSAAILLRTKRLMDDTQQCVSAESKKEGRQGGSKDKLPVATSPVPGSPWCVVWTGDDRMFFFNPTIHLSVWERPGELIGRDINHIIKDPPHKRKRSTLTDSCQSPDRHKNEDNEHFHDSKRNRLEKQMSLVCHPNEVKLLPLELRMARFREMMLERGVSAFSTYEKELHKMVFDPRYLLLTSDQRKQVFDVFVKSRLKDEYKEKKNKLQKVRDQFKQLLEEAKLTSRSTFKVFFARYHGDQRFSALNGKKEQEVLFQHYITSLKKRDKENRARKSGKPS